jgi:hypothetical protein
MGGEKMSVLSGTITADGGPLVDADVLIFDADSRVCPFIDGGSTDSGGNYAVDLPAGNFRVLVIHLSSSMPAATRAMIRSHWATARMIIVGDVISGGPLDLELFPAAAQPETSGSFTFGTDWVRQA